MAAAPAAVVVADDVLVLTGAGDVLTVDAAGILQLQGGETVTATSNDAARATT